MISDIAPPVVVQRLIGEALCELVMHIQDSEPLEKINFHHSTVTDAFSVILKFGLDPDLDHVQLVLHTFLVQRDLEWPQVDKEHRFENLVFHPSVTLKDLEGSVAVPPMTTVEKVYLRLVWGETPAFYHEQFINGLQLHLIDVPVYHSKKK